MIGHKIALLDGRQAGEEDLAPAYAVLSDLLNQVRAEVRPFPLRELKLSHCIGCFACWLETPGVCRFRDAGREIAQALMQCDSVIRDGWASACSAPAMQKRRASSSWW